MTADDDAEFKARTLELHEAIDARGRELDAAKEVVKACKEALLNAELDLKGFLHGYAKPLPLLDNTDLPTSVTIEARHWPGIAETAGRLRDGA